MAKTATEATLVRFCGQFSNGRPPKTQDNKDIPGDGAFGEDRGENFFWAVATPF